MNRLKQTGIILTGWIVLLLWVSGCGAAGPIDQAGLPSSPGKALKTDTASTPIPAASTLTPTAETTPTPSSTATPTPTATPTLHPMNIEAARQTDYPGSPITIVETLTAAVDYGRYIAWYQSEDLKIYGLLTIPDGEPPPGGWPAIVFNHGYIPPDVYRATERYTAYVDMLARSGYVVYRIDYRGHDRSDGEARGAYGDPGYTVDVLNAVAALGQSEWVDPRRIGMWGHSMGGYLTLRAMVISEEIRAGVIWAGVVADYADMYCCWRTPVPGAPTRTPDATQQTGWRRWLEQYGSPVDNPQFWQGLSANTFLEDLSGPLQLHHGTADTSVPVAFSRNLYQHMLEEGLPVEYYEYEGDDHNLSGQFYLAMQRTIEFFDRY